MGIIAPKGSGKTTLICNMLMFYRGYFNTIIIFSPSVASDEKWDYIKKQSLLVENKPLKKWMAKMAQARKQKDNVVEEAPAHIPLSGLVGNGDTEFDGVIPEKNFITEYHREDLVELMENQRSMVAFLKEHGESKHLANRILVVFDDLVGSDLFSITSNNPFKTFNTNHRHMSISALIVTQAYMVL